MSVFELDTLQEGPFTLLSEFSSRYEPSIVDAKIIAIVTTAMFRLIFNASGAVRFFMALGCV